MSLGHDKALCIVCHGQLDSTMRHLDDVVESSSGETVKTCLERVFEVSIPSSCQASCCHMCYMDLLKIQVYYNLVQTFRDRYQENLMELLSAPPISVFTSSSSHSVPLVILPEDSTDKSSFLQSHEPSPDLNIDVHTQSHTFPGTCFGSPAKAFKVEKRDPGKYSILDKLLSCQEAGDQLSPKSEHSSLQSETSEVGHCHNIEEKDGERDEGKRNDVPLVLQPISWAVDEYGYEGQNKHDESCSEKVPAPEDFQTEKSKTADDFEPTKIAKFRYTCNICGKTCLTDKRLQRHMITHTSSVPYKCEECSESFNREKALSIHGMTHGKGKIQQEISSRRLEMTNAVDVKTEPFEEGCSSKLGKKILKVCCHCGAKFQKAREFRSHLKSHQKGSTFRCHNCGTGFSEEKKLREHLNSCTGVRYPCPVCNKGCRTPSGLENHLRTHTGERPFECNYCHKKFKDKGNFKAHTRIHTGETAFKCSVCGEAFIHYTQKKKHEQTHADQIKPAFVCETCGRGFCWPGAYKKHLSMHANEKSHLCPICGKSFREKKFLNGHMKLHSEVKSFGCSYCEKAFKTRRYKKIHERIHTGEKPYVCHICGRAFTQYTGLQVHLKTH